MSDPDPDPLRPRAPSGFSACPRAGSNARYCLRGDPTPVPCGAEAACVPAGAPGTEAGGGGEAVGARPGDAPASLTRWRLS